MNNIVTTNNPMPGSRKLIFTVLILLAIAAFTIVFLAVDNAYFKFADARFPNVGSSAWLANLWGVVSRLHQIILIIPLILWWPRQLGFKIGKLGEHWLMLLIMLFANCGVIAAYLWLTGSTTPYSGNQWLVTEVITVPLVEEIFWRGLVISALLWAFRALYSENTSNQLAIWLGGITFGLLHANNLAAGVSINFVAIQVFNATIWGVVYGYARSKTESVYPSILLHAAMNLVVILF
jgi:membrane protease YdiL (CAAX protease family)